MANLIQIKRANTATAPATLSQGEMAYTANGGVLFIGDPSTSAVTAIGGVRNPGTLTANQALVANSTSGIDRVITGNLTVRSITANGVYSPGAGYLLSVDGGGNTYWLPQSAVTVNTAAQWTWTNTHTFTVGIVIGNSTILNISNSNIQYVGNSTTLPTVTIANTGVIQSGNSTITGAPQVIVANSTGTSTINAASISTTTLYGTTLFANVSASYANISGQVNTSTLYVTTSANIASATIANATGVYTTGTVNGAVLSVGTASIANATGFYTTGVLNSGNATNYVSANSTGLTINPVAVSVNGLTGNGYSLVQKATTWTDTGTTNGASFAINYMDAPTITASAAALTYNNTYNLYIKAPVAGANVTFGSSNTHNYALGTDSLIVGGSLIVATPSGVNLLSGSSTASLNLGTGINAGGAAITIGGTGTQLYTTQISGSTANVVLGIANGATASGANKLVSIGENGLAGSTTQINIGSSSATSTLNVFANTASFNANVNVTNNINAASHSVGTSFVANSSTLSAVSNALFVNSTSVVFTSGVTTVNAYSANVYAQNLTVSGNLVVSGTVMTVNTQTLAVNDNIIELGLNNTTTDAVDTGWFSPAGNSTSVWYSGLARIATKSSNNNPWFWLFGSNTNPNTATTVDTSANSVTGTIQAYLVPYGSQTGAFVVNAQSVAITANSTVNVNISANTLTLTTGLGAASGGTGRTTGFTAGDLLYASNTTYMSNLAIGVTGQVLQVSTGNLPSWGTLDGGTF
jgi:hypothetical protein